MMNIKILMNIAELLSHSIIWSIGLVYNIVQLITADVVVVVQSNL